MTDQQRYDAMSCHGGMARTPYLDRLAAEGIDFQAFYSHCPVCVPSRCCLFTGRYPHAHRVRQNHARLERHEVHLFKALKQVGYTLGYVEKNHLLTDDEFANFDHVDLKNHRSYEGARAAYGEFVQARRQRLRSVGSWASAVFHDFDPRLTDPYLSRQSAIEFLDRAPADRPFCLAVSFSDPHVPHLALSKYREVYPLDQIPVPRAPEGVLDGKAPRFVIKQRAQGALEASEEDVRRYLAVYYAMISWVDENVGAILAALEKNGQRENTIVVFSADHGDFNFDYNMCKKDLVLLDALLHVPFLLSWPGHISPRVVAQAMVEQVDVFPTLLELCEVEIPFGCQGRSLVPLIEGQAAQHKDVVYAEICPPHHRNPYPTYEAFIAAWHEGHDTPGHPLYRSAPFNVPGDYTKAIRTRTWKYIWYDGFEELYDLERDPHEWVNLALRDAYRARCTEMKERLFEWHALTEDPLDQMWHRRHLVQYDRWHN
jgi:arylsulfatase A-like enzyme